MKFRFRLPDPDYAGCPRDADGRPYGHPANIAAIESAGVANRILDTAPDIVCDICARIARIAQDTGAVVLVTTLRNAVRDVVDYPVPLDFPSAVARAVAAHCATTQEERLWLATTGRQMIEILSERGKLPDAGAYLVVGTYGEYD